MRMIAEPGGPTLRPGANGGAMFRGERRAVFFTSRNSWEPTSAPGLFNPATGHSRPLTMVETAKMCHGLFRIEVPLAAIPHAWADFCRDGGLPRKLTRGLERTAREVGSGPAEQWRHTYEPVPLALWSRVDIWNGERWVGNLIDPVRGLCMPVVLNEAGHHEIVWRGFAEIELTAESVAS